MERDARQIILESAIREFARKGYSGASVQDILKETGLSKPTLYYYFESKAGLFRAILDFAFDESLVGMQEKVKAARTARGKLEGVALAIFDFARKNPQLLRLVLGSTFAAAEEIPADSIPLEKRCRNYDFVKAVVVEGVESGELSSSFSPEELTHGIFGAISHMTRMHLLCGSGKLDAKTASKVVGLFLEGAKKR